MSTKVAIIIGMHRSGTSLVAGVLHHLGVPMGKDLMIGSTPEQPHGYYEDREFMHLNEHILTAAGGGWANVPEKTSLLAACINARDKVKTIVAERNAEFPKIWGFKDPRTTLTLPAYLPHIDCPKVLICSRNHQSILKSLAYRERGRWDERYMSRIATAYQEHLMDNIKLVQGVTLLVRFIDMIDPDERESQINRIINYLDIEPTEEQIQAALDHIRPEVRSQPGGPMKGEVTV